jgi:hypothetical protein
MRSTLAAVWLSVLVLSPSAAAAVVVVADGQLPAATAGAAVTQVGTADEIYLFGGFNDGGALQTLIHLTPAPPGQPPVFRTVGSFGPGRSFAGLGRALDGPFLDLLVIGGSTSTTPFNSTTLVEGLRSANRGQSFTRRALRALASASREACVGTLNGRTVVAGGITNTGATLDSVSELRAAGVPAPLARLLVATAGAGCAFDDARDLLYVIGGYNAAFGFHHRLQIFDRRANSWRFGADVPEALHDPAGAVGPNGKVYLFGGFSAGAPIDRLQVYDRPPTPGASGPRCPTPAAPRPRRAPTATSWSSVGSGRTARCAGSSAATSPSPTTRRAKTW